jgi:hypothetical protein
MPMTDDVDIRIRSLISELAEAAPPAPTISELESRGGVSAVPAKQVRRSAISPRGRLALLGGLAAVLAALLVVVLLPSVGQKLPVAEAAQLRLIAGNAAAQPQVTLNRGQWITTMAEISLSASVNRRVQPLSVPAEATIQGSFEVWENGFGEVCTSTTLDPASFPSTANETAWHALGLLDAPTGQPVGGCTSFAGGSLLNDSTLSTDPATLARQIETDTAGPSLTPGSGPMARVANILLGPAVGSSPALLSAVYRALLLIPGIHALGTITTHNGATGLAFANQAGTQATTIIVDPSTGALLEVRNLPEIVSLGNFTQSLAPSYLGPKSDLINEGPSLSATIPWLDPTSSFQVVSTGSLPSGLAPDPEPTAEIVVALKPAANDGPGLNHIVNTVATLVNSVIARSNGNLFEDGSGYNLGGGYSTLDFTFAGPSSAIGGVVQQLRNSNLIASVEVNTGQGFGP